jgi:hypothetical protein
MPSAKNTVPLERLRVPNNLTRPAKEVTPVNPADNDDDRDFTSKASL